MDVETGGFYERYDALLEIGAVALNLEGFPENCLLGEFHMKCRPAKDLRVSIEALQVQGLTPETAGSIWSRPHTEHDIFWAFVKFLREYLGETPDRWERKLWAQYAAFDSAFIYEASRRIPGTAGLFMSGGGRSGWCCTREFWKVLQGIGRVPVGRASGVDMASVLGIVNEKPHDALADATCTALCLKKMVDIVEGRLTL